jgi:hypothetical protein
MSFLLDKEYCARRMYAAADGLFVGQKLQTEKK